MLYQGDARIEPCARGVAQRTDFHGSANGYIGAFDAKEPGVRGLPARSIRGVRADTSVLPARVETGATPEPWLHVVDTETRGHECAERNVAAGTFGV